MGISSWFFGKGRNLKNSIVDVGDTLQTGLISNIGGLFSGGASAFRDLRASSQSFIMRELLDTKLSKKTFKKLYKSMHKFERYADPERINALFKRYSDPRQKNNFAKKCSKIISKAQKQLAIFVENYSLLIRIIRDELLKEKQMLAAENAYLVSAIGRLRKAIEANNVYISEEILMNARQLMAASVKAEIARLNKEYVADEEAERSVDERGILSKMLNFGAGHFIHKTKKFIKKWKNKEYKEFRSNLMILEQELSTGNVSPVTMMRMIKHANHFESSQRLLSEITKDAELSLAEVDKLGKRLIQSNLQFIGMFKQIPEIKNVLKELEMLKKTHAQAMAVITEDEADTQKLINYLNQINLSLNSTYNLIFGAVRKSLQNLNSTLVIANQPPNQKEINAALKAA